MSKKFYTIDLDEDVYNILCVYLFLFSPELKNGLSSTYSEILRKVFKEANDCCPPDSLLHYETADFDYILDWLNDL